MSSSDVYYVLSGELLQFFSQNTHRSLVANYEILSVSLNVNEFDGNFLN